jgi:hypothetical protein
MTPITLQNANIRLLSAVADLGTADLLFSSPQVGVVCYVIE